MMKISLLAVLLCWSGSLLGQGFDVSGRFFSQADSLEASGATIRIYPRGDSVLLTGTTTGDDGRFLIRDLSPGSYQLRCSYLGATDLVQTITVTDGPLDIGTQWLKTNDQLLKDVEVRGMVTRMEQLGDTTQFNANAYKTNPDATAEDLLSKMPGITSDNTGVKVNGETVKKVLIDGKPFFGTDPSLALKTLPAEVIDKIQVFDQLSEQSQFSGFDDGNTQKTINIRTKANKSNGQFGKIYAGYGTDDRYSLGGNLNYFNGERRITLNGISNNINEQNFSSEDLLGVQSGGGGRGGRDNAFMIGKQNGITRTTALGLNYSDAIGKKIKISGSYFYNNTRNTKNTTTERNFLATGDTAQRYKENSYSEANNENHRLNMRLEYTMDSSNSLVFTPTLSLQNNNSTSRQEGATLLGTDILQSLINNSSSSRSTGYNAGGDLLYRHKFGKTGRTISLNLGGKLNERSSDNKLYNLTQSRADTTLLDQEPQLYVNGYTLSGNLTYTEPLQQNSQLMLSYNPSYTRSSSDREARSFDPLTGDYTYLDTALSNKYDNTYITQKTGLTYRLNRDKANLMIGANLQYATLQGNQFFPAANRVSRDFVNVLPTVTYNYKFDKGTNLRLMYRTSTQAPDVAQLQDVIDITNPPFFSSGNPDLKQSYTHSLSARYGKTRAQRGKGLFFFVNAGYTQDYFGTESFIPTSDSVIRGDILLPRGGQYSRPVNLDGSWNIRSFMTYGMPLTLLKSNLNLNGGYTYTRNPAMVNNVMNFSSNNSVNGGLVLSSNISEQLDFTLSYNANYNIVNNTLRVAANSNYFNHNASFRVNWIFLDRFVLNTSLNQSLYTGLGQGFNQQFFLWNAYLGYKFLKDKSLEAKVSAYDILKQNRNINRTFNNTYFEDTRTQALTQYFMFSLTYTLRNFKGSTPPPAEDHGDHGGPRMRRPGGDGGDRGGF